MIMSKLTRRRALRVGAGMLGVALPEWLSIREQVRAESAAPKAKSCIVVYCWGGMSHHEGFDPKPDAPAEVRGGQPALRHNDANPEDVNGDGQCSPLDALLVINELNSGSAGSSEMFVDVNGGRYTIDAAYNGETLSETKDLTGRRYLRLRFTFNE